MTNSIEERLKHAEQICQQAGFQLTPIRKIILSFIYSQEKSFTAYELLEFFRNTSPKAQSMTVYRTLDFLQKHHLIHRVASKNAYVACSTPGEKHQAQMLLCEKCNTTKELQTLIFSDAAKILGAAHHFILSDAPIEIKGICINCISS